mmetsp:Transcript_39178/g.54390  ORF Transcript_39178/g.54390 Transcript_39178/m.54390 type:complete len:211 (-) Transcript_39178:2781-3413(-)
MRDVPRVQSLATHHLPAGKHGVCHSHKSEPVLGAGGGQPVHQERPRVQEMPVQLHQVVGRIHPNLRAVSHCRTQPLVDLMESNNSFIRNSLFGEDPELSTRDDASNLSEERDVELPGLRNHLHLHLPAEVAQDMRRQFRRGVWTRGLGRISQRREVSHPSVPLQHCDLLRIPPEHVLHVIEHVGPVASQLGQDAHLLALLLEHHPPPPSP